MMDLDVEQAGNEKESGCDARRRIPLGLSSILTIHPAGGLDSSAHSSSSLDSRFAAGWFWDQVT